VITDQRKVEPRQNFEAPSRAIHGESHPGSRKGRITSSQASCCCSGRCGPRRAELAQATASSGRQASHALCRRAAHRKSCQSTAVDQGKGRIRHRQPEPASPHPAGEGGRGFSQEVIAARDRLSRAEADWKFLQHKGHPALFPLTTRKKFRLIWANAEAVGQGA